MSDELTKALRRIAKVSYGATIEEARSVSKTQREAADLIEQQASEIANLKHDIERHIANHSADLESAEKEAVPVAWQPIETAPKTDRTLLLGYINTAGKWRTTRGQWMSEAYIAEQWEDPDDAEPGWYETSVEADDAPNCWPIMPTHWMPLPTEPGTDNAAPTSKDAIRREALEADASRYQWLRDRYTGFDFDWMADDDGKNGKQVICFGMDEGMRIGRDVDAAIDDAIRALSQKVGDQQ